MDERKDDGLQTPATKSSYTSLGRPSVERPYLDEPKRTPPQQCHLLARGAGGGAVLLGIVVFLGLGAAMIATTPPAAAVVRYGMAEPQRKRSVGGKLNAKLRVGAGPDEFGVVNRRYNRGAPGATLTVSPGDVMTVRVENDLGPEAPGDSKRTGLRHPNTTSLHVHGWHVSPREDDVFTLVPPGTKKTYTYHLPATHPAGTFWYHAHATGSSSLQVLGMLGALVVLDADHRRLPPDVVLVLTQTNLVAGKSRNYAWGSAASGSRIKPLPSSPLGADANAAALAVKKGLKPPLNESFFAVNGRLRPTLRPAAKEWLRWRLVHAGSNDVLVLELDDPTACEAIVVARDGYSRPAPLKSALTRDRPLVMAPGSRADVYVACAKPAVLRSRKKGLEAYLGSGSDVYDGAILRIKPVPKDKKYAKPVFPAPARAPSLLATPPDRKATLNMIEGGPVVRDGNGYTDYGFDVVDGDGTVRVGDVVEWTILNEKVGPVGDQKPQVTTHPFHLHTNHYQIVSASHGLGIDYDVGDWRDTITLPTPGNVTVRFRAADFDGPSLAHCHIFSHADLGMDYPFEILPALVA